MLDQKTKNDIVEILKDFRECSICREPFESVQTELNATQYVCRDCVSDIFTRDVSNLYGSYRGDSPLDD
jgi:hypothetical protein